MCVLLLVCACYAAPLKAQMVLPDDYAPIVLSDKNIPKDFLRCAQGNLLVQLPAVGLNKKSNKNAEKFTSLTAVQLREIFLGGYVYYNDTLSGYVKRVLARVLASDTALLHKLHPFVTRFPFVNATTWQDGTILINVGLLKRVENEAQLAFIIGHEITHFAKNHGYQSFILVNEPPRNIKNALSLIPYANKDELTADLNGLQLMRTAGYDVREALKAIALLEDDKGDNLDIIAALSTPQVKLAATDLCDKTQLTQFVSPQTNLTTPTGERLLSLAERVKTLKTQFLPTDTVSACFKLPPADFAAIRTIATYETLENNYQQGDYMRATYDALVLLQAQPNNKYAATRAAQSMYGLAMYSKTNNLNNILFEKKQLVNMNFTKFYCFIGGSTKDNILQQICYSFVEKIYAKYPDNENLLLTMAQATELYQGIDMAQKHYLRYAQLYAKGKQIEFVQNKIKK